MVLKGIVLLLNGIVIIVSCFAWSKDNNETLKGLIAGGFAAIAILFGIVALVALPLEEQEIKAIDVYRGKTTLEVTYRDSVAIDSIVVWKTKIDKNETKK